MRLLRKLRRPRPSLRRLGLPQLSGGGGPAPAQGPLPPAAPAEKAPAHPARKSRRHAGRLGPAPAAASGPIGDELLYASRGTGQSREATTVERLGAAGADGWAAAARTRVHTHARAMVVVASAQSPAAGAPKVLLLSGQPAAAAAAGAPGGRNVPLMLPGQRGASSEAESGGPPLARKRQRLTHLSPEEKALRRWARGPGSEIGSEPGSEARGLGLDRAALARAPSAWRVGCQRGAGRGRKSGLTASTALRGARAARAFLCFFFVSFFSSSGGGDA